MAKKRTQKLVYYFGDRETEGNITMKDTLGGKGAGLADMAKAGVPVPPGFTITTEVCNYFYDHNNKLPSELDKQIKSALKKIEKSVNKKLGDSKNPLLVSVRSGARFSMPGMMDTILNLGLNDENVVNLIKTTKNPRFVYDTYRRFIQMFGNVVLGIAKEQFEEILTEIKEKRNIKYDFDLREDDLKEIISQYKKLIREITKHDLPVDAYQQLKMARDAVFKSWNNPRAQTYRRLNKISDDLGTAVNIQVMVFGNMGNDCATGVGFTRNPATGENQFYGEYLINAQGEDVVAGVRTPQPIASLAKDMPLVYRQLKTITKRLEKHYKDVQDFEFTVEKNKLYILQTRTGKRTARAAIKNAVDMVKEKMISKEVAILRVEPEQINQLLHPILDPKIKSQAIGRGLPASPGAAVGHVVFSSEEATALGVDKPVILVRTETCPDDIHGMEVAQGVLTARGGMTSHAAVVARGMGRCCVVGCEELKVDEKNKKFHLGKNIVNEGDWLTLDGNTGQIILGKVATVQPTLSGEFGQLMKWVDEIKQLKVRANADMPRDAKMARIFGAEGIGLCRTEHMFFDKDRLPYIQEMIIADTEETRRAALNKLLPFQKEDFKELFKEMRGYPVTVRTLDPPLHEFLPKDQKEAKELSEKIKISEEKIWAKAQELHEFNPMLGHRGCRLGITYPEITEMQVRAIISAACELKKENIKVVPEIMIPLVGNVNELKNQKDVVKKIAAEVMKQYKTKIEYLVGTMIEVPRAAVTADQIAQEADFFSFGTNDLTQMGMGFSRDDSGKFIKVYLNKKIIAADPFQSLDQEGIGQLVKIGINKGRSVKKGLKIGICGEHGGDSASIGFCYEAGMNYVSCSPYRVPIARIAAAQAVVKRKLKIEHTSK
ncbi:MAG: pyruvate, phosphate dikinase [Patescibacteria group bacterium]|nr:pyruvate, phosphate dikinase [Patescibacteria group bacterium]MDD5121521.1 pyruvate, phosphate dikinase [Patescibacteria group bacterium]MDD5221851.1 pyruvate, phosphate dikinase [Patescibacteria group bacterium]MDD5396316.1 pyruvate, phosphate dikinase [Patescibacteria group bacterium]